MDLVKSLDFMDSKKFRNPSTTSWFISGLGIAVSALGTRMLDKKIGAGILGFGLAHLILGQLDRMRPTIKNRW